MERTRHPSLLSLRLSGTPFLAARRNRTARDRLVYPVWQFAPGVLRHLPRVLAAAGHDPERASSGWTIATWLATPDPRVGDRTPLELLRADGLGHVVVFGGGVKERDFLDNVVDGIAHIEQLGLGVPGDVERRKVGSVEPCRSGERTSPSATRAGGAYRVMSIIGMLPAAGDGASRDGRHRPSRLVPHRDAG